MGFGIGTQADETAWPPEGDPRVWAGIALGGALPTLAWALDAPFLWGMSERGFVGTDPMAWAVLQPVLALAMWLRSGPPFSLAMWLQLPIGLALMFSLLQAPAAFVGAGHARGLEGLGYYELGLSYALAFATGAVFTGLSAYLLRLSLRR